jgi:uncharacterized protein (TIGR03437 family)
VTGSPAQTLTALVSFNGTNGALPERGSLVQGTDGNFYGTTSQGGAGSCPPSVGCGTVFKITPGGALTTLHTFDGADGYSPLSGLIQATDGNFYGTTSQGGTGSGAGSFGTIFKITPGGILTTLHTFDSIYGYNPSSGLIQATDGNLYGTTLNGCNPVVLPVITYGCYGTIFIFGLSDGGEGTLYGFCSQSGCADGEDPSTGLIQATDGSLYGTTSAGGTYNDGTVFKIALVGGTLTTLYSFTGGADGASPQTALIQATDGNLYGTTPGGGSNGNGTIFGITLNGTLTTLYYFMAGFDGADPQAPLIQGADGNLYGTTSAGGASNGGTIFRIALAGGTLTTLCSFAGGADGGVPLGGLIQGTDGNLYGTTSAGGANNDGTIFRLSLPAATLPAIGSVADAASFQAGIVPNSWITIFGTNLSSITDNWANAILNGNLPTSLDGVSVSVGGELAYISYINPTQINAVAPNVGTGTVPVTVTNSSGNSPAVTAVSQTVQPAFFQWGSYAVATRQDYSLAVKNGTFPGLTTVPAKPGDVIILWGTAFGSTSPPAPVGIQVPSGVTYYTADPVTVTVGSTAAKVYGAALSPGYAGLYQVAIQIPTSLANGDYPVIATVSDQPSPSTTLITVQN